MNAVPESVPLEVWEVINTESMAGMLAPGPGLAHVVENASRWEVITKALELLAEAGMLAKPGRELAGLAQRVREVNSSNGWDDPLGDAVAILANLALIHSEVSEAVEEVRDAHLDEYLTIEGVRVVPAWSPTRGDFWREDVRACPREYDGTTVPKPEGLPSELADIIIRALDTAARMGIDIDRAVATKLAYNRTRGHHHGGKAL